MPRFSEEGYEIIPNLLTTQQVEWANTSLAELIDQGFEGVQYEVEVKEGTNQQHRRDLVRKITHYTKRSPYLRSISLLPVLLRHVEELLGSKSEMVVENALLKPPFIGRDKPWHQDSAIFDLPVDCPVVGAWISLDQADEENGCMQVIPGSHKKGAVPHYMLKDWQLCDRDVPEGETVNIPLNPGDCLLWDGLLFHGSQPNKSSRRRRALQFHYKPASVPWIKKEERLKNFDGVLQGKSC